MPSRRPRLILVGESPAHGSLIGREEDALTGSSGRNLCKIAGWEWEDYLKYTERRNLFYVEIPEGRWRPDLARVQAAFMAGEVAGRGVRVVLLGQKVKAAFDAFLKTDVPLLDWAVVGKKVGRRDFRFTVGYIPHPSGRNRVWNDPEKVALAREFLHDLL